jgi:hypothetical protein
MDRKTRACQVPDLLWTQQPEDSFNEPRMDGGACLLATDGLVVSPSSPNPKSSTILYYTILYYTILYYTILYYTILYYTILYYTILDHTILCTIL